MFALWDIIRGIAFTIVALLFSCLLSWLFIAGYILLLNLHLLFIILILLLYAAIMWICIMYGLLWIFSKLVILLRPVPKFTNIFLVIIYICVSLFVSINVLVLSRETIPYFLWLFICGLPWSLNSWLILVGKSVKEQNRRVV